MSNAPAQTPFENGDVLLRIAVALERIAEHAAPQLPDKVGTPYVAKKLGCTTVWIAEQIRSGRILYIFKNMISLLREDGH
jgi:hypothetical protein